MTSLLTMTATTSKGDYDNFTSQKLLNILEQLRAPTNFFDSLKLAHGIVPERGDLLIIQKSFLEDLKRIRGVVVPFWVKGSSFLPKKEEGYIIRGDWPDLLAKYSRKFEVRDCTECGESYETFKDSDAIMCQTCDVKEKFGG